MSRLTSQDIKRKARKAINQCPGQMSFFAPIDIEARVEGDELPSVTIQAYNGDKMKLNGFPHPVVIELASAAFAVKHTPLLRDHDFGRPVGHAEDQVINAEGIQLVGKLSMPGMERDQIVAAAKSGFAWQASVGARDYKLEFVAEGRSREVNGRRFEGPVLIARNAMIREVSILPVGADKTTSVAIAATLSDGECDMEFEKWLSAQGWEPEKLSAEQTDWLKARFEKEVGDEPAPAPKAEPKPEPIQASADDYRKQAAEEARKIGEIRAACQKAGIVETKVGDQEVILEAHAIENNWSLDQLKTHIELHNLRENRRANHGPAIHASGSNSNLSGQVLEASLCRSQLMWGDDKLEQFFDEKTLEASASKNLRNMGVHEVFDRVIRAAGKYFDGTRKSEDFIRTAFDASNKLEASGTTTMSLSNIFENVLNKQLLSQFNAVAVVWNRITRERSLNDFKAHALYRLEGNGGFQTVADDGELKHVGLIDSKSTLSAETKGLMMSLTRKDIINDDMGALNQRVEIIARKAAISIEEAVFKTLLGGVGSFFTAGNGNYIDGAATALDFDSLKTAREKFRNFVDANGMPISVAPRKLLLPTTLESTAARILNSQEVRVGGGSSKDRVGVVNEFFNAYEPIVSPYMNNTSIKDATGAAISGQSDTAWLLMADPMDLACLYIGFLNGRRVPTVENSDMSFEKLGIQMRAYFDFGVAFGPDHECAVYSKGAA